MYYSIDYSIHTSVCSGQRAAAERSEAELR